MKRRHEEDYRNIGGHLKHVSESLMLLSALALDGRYLTLFTDEEIAREEGCEVCEIWDRIENVGREQGLKAGLEAGRMEGLEAGRMEGVESGRMQGQEQVVALLNKLYENGRDNDIRKVLSDAVYRGKLLKEFSIMA